MLSTATRAARPKLSLNVAAVPARPTLSLKSPSAIPRTPLSPSPLSPTAYNTRANQRGFCTGQQPTFSYPIPVGTKSILKRTSSTSSASSSSSSSRKIQFDDQPVVHCITPVSLEDGDSSAAAYVRVTREMRWSRSYDGL
ncbi:hypothetical protein L228DRAFT_236151 [Xylona heveae TC161]|uniref:Uncharacterized protein n=1 Tax=Xylona heveae (strain CBS 132557 / TC161) TaxID=1328760 RepID=A0A165IK22_XYLHT|nr:hypothetical protein L228DRAFT_236151 [Xylona heveae TC161]KZF25006.1 hypothetical protein L228DRAFT_236151 [Xylona heveae TC161]